MKDYINSVIKAFSILEQFNLIDYEIGLTELHEKTGLPFSTLHRQLATMQSLGYISQNKENNKYSLGYKLMILGNNVRFTNELKAIAKPYMTELYEKYNETIHLGIEIDKALFMVDKIEMLNRGISVAPNYGKAMSIHASGMGKTLLAYKYQDNIHEVLEEINLVKLSPNTITDKGDLIKELEKIRGQGYAVDNEELEVGLTCVAAPIFNHAGSCIAAISVSFLNARVTTAVETIKDDVVEAAQKISRALGYRG